jgi:HAD superfamily hydrolase (TIGR01509 family)
MTRPKAIFFDVGNTLLFPNRDRIYVPLYQRELVPTDQQLRALERTTKNEFDNLLADGRPDHGFWYLFYTHLLEELRINDEPLRNALVEATHDSGNWDNIRPGTCQILKKIGQQYRIGVISNADGKIHQVLERCGIAGCFLSITDSGIVGREKPHPFIFETALKTLDARPEESLYVGDVYSVDYLGATRVGMQAMLFDVPGAYTGRGLPRVESLDDLQIVLQS